MPNALDLLREMYRIRRFEERVKELYSYGLITGAVHLYIGQEAVAVGACSALRPDDFVTSTHRGHGHALAKGLEMRRVMAELLGRSTGYCRGHGGSMHLFDTTLGLLGGNGIVGGGLPIALGAAVSAQNRNTDQVAVCFFSDGASNQGTFHESLNMAALWKAPVIYLCENNQYANTTPTAEAVPIPDIASRAAAYDMPGVIVDGNDVEAVCEVTDLAVTRARTGMGPSLIEAKTYRLEGHCMVSSTPRDPEEVAAWRARDPIVGFEARLLERGDVTESDLATMRAEVEAEVEESAQYAQESPFPSPEQMGSVDLPGSVG